MEEIFPRKKFKTYSNRIKTLDSKKQRASQQLESDPNIRNAGKESQDKLKDKRKQKGKKTMAKGKKRSATLRSSKEKKTGRIQRKPKNKTARESLGQQNLSLGMFDSHLEEGDRTVGEPEVPVPPQTEMKDSLTTKGKYERYHGKKCHKAFANQESPVQPVQVLFDQVHILRYTCTDGEASLPGEEMECEDRVTAWLSSQDQQDNTKSSIEIMMEEARTVHERKKKCFPAEFYRNIDRVLQHVTDFKETEQSIRHNQPYKTEEFELSPIPYEDHQETTAQTALENISVTDSLKEKEQSEKTPGKKTSFAVPGSPVKLHKVKHHKMSPLGSVPRSSTRLFQTNIEPLEEFPQVSSIQADTDQDTRFINSEVSGSAVAAKTAVPVTPEVQGLSKLPRLTSTPNRKTSTPNQDGYQLHQFEFDLSSVSAVNSEEEALIPHQSRDVVSDEHMDLSKTRIEEPSGEYVSQPVVNKILLSAKGTRPSSVPEQPTTRQSEQSIHATVETDHLYRHNVEIDRGSRKIFARSNTANNVGKDPCDTVRMNINTSEKEAENKRYCGNNWKQQEVLVDSSVFEADRDGMARCLSENIPRDTSAFLSFNIKQKNQKQSLKQAVSKGKQSAIKEICSLMSQKFVCPARSDYVWQYHRECTESYHDMKARLPIDDLL